MHFRVPADLEMTPEVLAKYISKHKAEKTARFEKLDKAYKNDYDIFHLPQKPVGKPDNRISANFAKYLVDTFEGFFCGIPIKTASDSDVVNDFLEKIDAYNDQDNNNAELSKLSSIFGSAHEMYFIDDDGNEGITYLSPMDSFFLIDESILGKPLYFIHYYLDSNNVERGSWSDATQVQHFVSNGSYKWDGEASLHGFDDVPATEYSENAEQIGVFESVLSLIDGYNKGISGEANDGDYFSDAYMKIIGKKLEDDDVNNIRDKRVINIWSDDPDDNNLDADFMQRPSGDTTMEHFLDRTERLIFVLSMIPNINDENFGTSSGIALRYKLQSMSNLAKTKERKFRSGMNRRYKILFSNPVIMGSGVKPDDWMNVDVQFTRNYPANISDEANTAKELEGVVSKQTQLSVLSIVDNPKQEIERMEKENADNLDVYGDLKQKTPTDDDDSKTAGASGKQASTYEITSILNQHAKGQLTYNNALRMLERLGFDEQTARAMLDDKDVKAE